MIILKLTIIIIINYNININFNGDNTFIIKNNQNKFDANSENSNNFNMIKSCQKSDLKKINCLKVRQAQTIIDQVQKMAIMRTKMKIMISLH